MKRFFTLLFLFFTVFSVGQNLIPDPSAEDYALCPTGLGILETWLPTWNTYRGTPDYFNNCSNGLGNSNPVGFQEPRTGEGYIGAILHHTSLPNAREYFGIEFLTPMQSGITYDISFYTSLAYRITGGSRTACDNLGFLLMTDNYLDGNEQGTIPNFSHFFLTNILTDTTNWVHVETSIVADSSYSMIAFGNFFDDSQTNFEFPFAPDNAGLAYYYFDDFCITTSENQCGNFLATSEYETQFNPSIWPNPSGTFLNYSDNMNISEINIYNMQGQQVYSERRNKNNQKTIEHNLQKGIYLIKFMTDKGVVTKRFMVE